MNVELRYDTRTTSETTFIANVANQNNRTGKIEEMERRLEEDWIGSEI